MCRGKDFKKIVRLRKKGLTIETMCVLQDVDKMHACEALLSDLDIKKQLYFAFYCFYVKTIKVRKYVQLLHVLL